MKQPNDSSTTTVRIAIAHGRDLVRAGLRAILESVPSWRVAGEAANGATLIAIAKRLAPDAAIVALDLQGMDGFGMIDSIREVSPRTLTILLAPHEGGDLDEEDLAERARTAGAQGWITQASSSAEVIAEIRHAIRRTMNPGAELLPNRTPTHLTARELEVIQLIAAGCSSTVAGRMLGISAKTVERHRYNIMKKMELSSVVEVVHFAIREHLIAV